MHLITREIRIPSHTTEIRIVPLGCTHMGAYGCQQDKVDWWLRYVYERENTYCILLGDLVDSIHEKDKRYNEDEVADWCIGTKANRHRWGNTLIDRQFKFALERFRPLAERGKILWIHAGNHEHKLVTTASRDLTRDWARSLDVPYAGLAALSQLIIRTGDGRKGSSNSGVKRLTFFTTHGGGAAQSNGGVINRVASMLNGYDVDVALMAHLHRSMHVRQVMHSITANGRRKVRERVAAVCGTFLDGHCEGANSYAELKGYNPVALGPPVVHIKRRLRSRVSKGDPDGTTDYTNLWVSDSTRSVDDE